MSVSIRPYLSPTLVLLALDWDKGRTEQEFLGFAIKRIPGFRSADGTSREAESWLPNRVTFQGPVPNGKPDVASDDAPIQKFMWWDARMEPADRSLSFVYKAYPVVGTVSNHDVALTEEGTCQVTLPRTSSMAWVLGSTVPC